MSKNELGGFIKEIRLSQNLSKSEMARYSGVSQPYMSQIETGKRIPTPDILEKIANNLTKNLHYKVSFADLLDKSGYSKLAKGQRLLESVALEFAKPMPDKPQLGTGNVRNANVVAEHEKSYMPESFIRDIKKWNTWIKAENEETYSLSDGQKIKIQLDENNLYNLKRILNQNDKPVSWNEPREESFVLPQNLKRLLYTVIEANIEIYKEIIKDAELTEKKET